MIKLRKRMLGLLLATCMLSSNLAVAQTTHFAEEKTVDTTFTSSTFKMSKEDVALYRALVNGKKEAQAVIVSDILEDNQLKKITNEKVTVESYAKDNNWNMVMTNMDQAQMESKRNQEKVKVAIIDSGVNLSSDIDVFERKSFLDEEEQKNVLFEDFTGHGTGVAGVIAAKMNDEGITGIDSNIQLYSARVLDHNNEAPISRVIKAIDWAIEKQVNIVNISFVTDVNSVELHDAVKRAYDAGILLIASAGNDNELMYPAAYEEVMAVGSVDSKGDISKNSPEGVEIVAPGELITTSDVFDSLSVHSGTSFAAPHVTGLAAKLWSKTPDANHEFIRAVIDASANLYGSKEQYGFGLIDYKYASELSNALQPIADSDAVYSALMEFLIEIKQISNKNTIEVKDTVSSVEGAWDISGHQGTIGDFSFINSKNGRTLIMYGCELQDRSAITKLDGTTRHPFFHGYRWYGSPSDPAKLERNYLASYIYLTQIANALCHSAKIPACPDVLKEPDKTSGLNRGMDGTIDYTYVNKRDGVTWEAAQKKMDGYFKNNVFNAKYDSHKGLIVWGMAMHHAADIFSHSSYGLSNNKDFPNKRITHWKGDDKDTAFADKVGYIPQRYEAAKEVVKKTLSHLDRSDVKGGEPGTLKDFALTTAYNKYYYIGGFDANAKEVCSIPYFKETYDSKYKNLSKPS